MKETLSKAMRLVAGLLRENRMLFGIALILVLAGGLLVVSVLWPAYKSPGSKMYDSGLGYASLMRKLGKAFPVVTAEVRRGNS